MFRRKKQEMSSFARARHDIQGRIVSGLIVLIPLGITVFILDFLFSMTIGLIKPITGLFLKDMPEYALNAISISILIVGLYFVGLVTANIVGRQFISLGEGIIKRIPIVKTIYIASKQVVDAFSIRDKAASLRAVALVEFPSEGLRSIGFVTGTLHDELGRQCYRVFVPTTPNPTTGFFLIVPPEKVFLTAISVEDACKMLMSGGIVCPDTICGVQSATVPGANGSEESAAV